MTEPAPRRGRRARTLTPEEIAADEARAAPGVRGAVAAPAGDEPTPTLRRFGRRARIVEVDGSEPVTESAEAGSAATITRDHDGVELGELPVTDAPDPRPAPRFEGTVLHRPEKSGGRALLWLVWALVAIALVVLVALLLTGVIGPGTAAALTEATDPTALLIDHPVLEEPAA